MLKGLPILLDMHGVPVTSATQAARRWQQHFVTLELAATFELQDMDALQGHFGRVQYERMSSAPGRSHRLPPLPSFSGRAGRPRWPQQGVTV